MDESLQEYRKHLVAAEQKAQEDFDKTVVSLSGGALGVSFVFLKDIVGAGQIVHPSLLLAAWLFWGASITSVLSSFFVSSLTLRRTIKQVDSERVHSERPGGRFDFLTAILNAAGGVLFFVGVILIGFFVWFNLEAINVKQK